MDLSLSVADSEQTVMLPDGVCSGGSDSQRFGPRVLRY